MTYINKHERAFRHLANIKDNLEPRRSEGRIKSYSSASDVRAWCDDVEQRRQHILELTRKPVAARHDAVPLNDLLEVMGAKKSDKKRLKCLSNQLLGLIKDEPLDDKKQDQLEDLRDFYDEIVGDKKPKRKGCKGLNRIKGKRDRLLAEKRKSIDDGDSSSSGVTSDTTTGLSSEKETYSGEDKARKRGKDDPFVVSRSKGPTKIETSVKLNVKPDDVSIDESDPNKVIVRSQIPKPSKSAPPERGGKRNYEQGGSDTEKPKKKKPSDKGAKESKSEPSKFKDDKKRQKKNMNGKSPSGSSLCELDKGECSEDDDRAGQKVKFKRKSIQSDDHPRYRKQGESYSTTTESFDKGAGAVSPGKTGETGTPLVSKLKKPREKETSRKPPPKGEESDDGDPGRIRGRIREQRKAEKTREKEEGRRGSREERAKTPSPGKGRDKKGGDEDGESKRKPRRTSSEGKVDEKGKSKSPTKRRLSDDRSGKRDSDDKVKAKPAKDEKRDGVDRKGKSKSPAKRRPSDDSRSSLDRSSKQDSDPKLKGKSGKDDGIGKKDGDLKVKAKPGKDDGIGKKDGDLKVKAKPGKDDRSDKQDDDDKVKTKPAKDEKPDSSGRKAKSKSPTKRRPSEDSRSSVEISSKQDSEVKVKGIPDKDSLDSKEITKPLKDKDERARKARRSSADDKVKEDVNKGQKRPSKIPIKGDEKGAKGKEFPTIKEPEFEEEVTEEAVIVKMGHHKDKGAQAAGAGDEELKNKVNVLTKQLNDANKTIEALKKQAVCSNTCAKELEELEKEIEDLRSGKIAPETLIRKHTALIRKCCNLIGESKILDVPPPQPGKLNDMKNRASSIDKLNLDKDMLTEKVKNLERELEQYKELPEKLKDYQEKCDLLAKTIEERDRLLEEVKRLKDALEETDKFKGDAQRVPDLQKQLLEKEKTNRSSLVELTKARSQVGEMGDALAEAKREKELLMNQLKALDLELSKMKDKAKENDILKVEKENLEAKLKETKGTPGEFDDLIKKGKEYDSLKNEKDLYKSKYEELVKLECHCDMLKAQLDAAKTMGVERDILMKKVGDMQACLCDREKELMSAQAEIEALKESNKSGGGELAPERDTSPQDLSIAGVSENTQSLRLKVDSLEKELAQTKFTLAQKTSQIKHLQQSMGDKDGSYSDNDAVAKIKRELEAAKAENKKLQEIANKMVSITGDEHVQQMLKQSECAVKRVCEELGKQYEHWGMLKVRNVGKRRLGGNPKSPDYERSFSQGPPVKGECALLTHLSRFKERVDVLEAENAKLRTNVQETICKNGPGGGYLKQEMAEIVAQKEKLEKQLRTEMNKRSLLEKQRKPPNLPDCDC